MLVCCFMMQVQAKQVKMQPEAEPTIEELEQQL
jgi:hypothetical protein